MERLNKMNDYNFFVEFNKMVFNLSTKKFLQLKKIMEYLEWDRGQNKICEIRFQ